MASWWWRGWPLQTPARTNCPDSFAFNNKRSGITPVQGWTTQLQDSWTQIPPTNSTVNTLSILPIRLQRGKQSPVSPRPPPSPIFSSGCYHGEGHVVGCVMCASMVTCSDLCRSLVDALHVAGASHQNRPRQGFISILHGASSARIVVQHNTVAPKRDLLLLP